MIEERAWIINYTWYIILQFSRKFINCQRCWSTGVDAYDYATYPRGQIPRRNREYGVRYCRNIGTRMKIVIDESYICARQERNMTSNFLKFSNDRTNETFSQKFDFLLGRHNMTGDRTRNFSKNFNNSFLKNKSNSWNFLWVIDWMNESLI